MRAVLSVLAAAVLFGTTGTAQALGPDTTTPFAVGAARLVIGGAALAAIAFTLAARHHRGVRGGMRRDGRHDERSGASSARPRFGLRAAALMATTGICLALYQPLFFVGTARNGVAVGTVIALGSAPVLAGFVEWLISRRVPSTTWIAATALATVGVVLLGVGGSAAGAGGGAGGTDAVGLLGSLGAGASFAVFANAQRRLMDDGWDPFTVAGAMGLGAAVCGLLMLPFTDLSWLASREGLTLAMWLGVATIAVAYTLFTWGLERLTAATAATLTLAEPLTAGLLGVVLLGERLSPLAVVGVAVLGGGLVLLAWASGRAQSPRPVPLEG